jgi:hypothetical protein
MNIYVASSWRNDHHPSVVKALRELGHEVYDFRNPPKNDILNWDGKHPWWENLTYEEKLNLLTNPVAQKAFRVDMNELMTCDMCVLVLPSGRSAHLEFGYACGKLLCRTVVLLDDKEPELMTLMADKLCKNLEELVEYVGKPGAFMKGEK